MLHLFGNSLVLTMAIAGISACIDVAVHFARGGIAATQPTYGSSRRAAGNRSGSVILRPAFGAAH